MQEITQFVKHIELVQSCETSFQSSIDHLSYTDKRFLNPSLAKSVLYACERAEENKCLYSRIRPA